MHFPAENAGMCNVKGCARPSFVGGRCGYHALAGWGGRRDARPAATVARAADRAPQRRRPVPRPVSG